MWKTFLKNLLFPKFCLGCEREGNYLCKDCKSLIDIMEEQYCLCSNPKRKIKCSECKEKKLDGLYFAVSYHDFLIKKLIKNFRDSFIKDLSGELASLIITHFRLLNKGSFWKNKVLIPNPYYKKGIKRIGFGPSYELAKELSLKFKIPLIKKGLIRKEKLKVNKVVKDKNIFLVDVVYNSSLEKEAKVLKKKGAKEVWGVVVARK